MKKTILITFSIFLFLAANLPAQDTAANDAYIKAMTAKTPGEKAQMLKAWINQYGGKNLQYENFANAALCTDQYPGKTANDVINYGEKALNLGGLDDSTKASVLINVASIYTNQGQNLSKAKNYASQLIQLANTAKGQEGANTQLWNQMTGAAHFITGQALQKENNDKAAVNSYINAYNILKNKQIIASLAQLGQSLYEAKAYADAEKALRVAVPVLNTGPVIGLLAKTLHRSRKNSEALKYYKLSYEKQRSGDIAYNIGLLLAAQAKSNSALVGETIQYLLEASFLSPANSKQAMELAQSFHFSQNPNYNKQVKALQEKSKELADLTNTFNEKFGDKTEDDLSGAEKREMDGLLNLIKTVEAEVNKLQAAQQGELDKWNEKIAATKKKLGIK